MVVSHAETSLPVSTSDNYWFLNLRQKVGYDFENCNHATVYTIFKSSAEDACAELSFDSIDAAGPHVKLDVSSMTPTDWEAACWMKIEPKLPNGEAFMKPLYFPLPVLSPGAPPEQIVAFNEDDKLWDGMMRLETVGPAASSWVVNSALGTAVAVGNAAGSHKFGFYTDAGENLAKDWSAWDIVLKLTVSAPMNTVTFKVRLS